MKLVEDLSAPVFNLKDIYGRSVDLNQYRDRKILISFFRHVGCPFCNLRVHTLMKVHKELKDKGLEMIFFFESKESVILRSTFHQEISPIPIIADPTKEWYKIYGLEPSTAKATMSHMSAFIQTVLDAKKIGAPIHIMASGESFSTMPAEFLIDRNLKIKRVHYAERLNQRIDVTDIREFALSGQVLEPVLR